MMLDMHSGNLDAIVDRFIADIKRIRLEQGLSHEALAQKARLNRSAISLIESRKRQPTLLTCLKIAKALNIDMHKVLKKAETDA